MQRHRFPRKGWKSCCCSIKLLPFTDVNLLLLSGAFVLLLEVMMVLFVLCVFDGVGVVAGVVDFVGFAGVSGIVDSGVLLVLVLVVLLVLLLLVLLVFDANQFVDVAEIVRRLKFEKT